MEESPVPIEEHTPVHASEIPPGATQFAEHLVDVLADRAYGKGEDPESTSVPPSLVDIPEGNRDNALTNISALRQLNGHRGSMLRKRVQSGGTLHCAHLRELFLW